MLAPGPVIHTATRLTEMAPTWEGLKYGEQRVHITRTKASGSGGTYRAAVCEELNKPLQVRQLPRPSLEGGQVRVGIHSVGINFSDILVCKGQYQEKPKLPFVPGSECGGQVLEVGPGVTYVKPGDKVSIIAREYGAFAEEMVLSAQHMIKVPSHIHLSELSALLCSYSTAYTALKHTANIQPGETVLVTAAAGGVGLAAVELATSVFGAKVIGAAGGPEKCNLVRRKGAIATIDYNSESIRERMKALTDGGGANVILDAVGGKTFEECLRSVAFEGRIVVIGFASGVIPKVPANILLVKSCSVRGVYWGSYSVRHPEIFRESVEACIKYLAEGKIKPHICQEFPLENANEALDYLSARKSTGKVVLKPQ